MSSLDDYVFNLEVFQAPTNENPTEDERQRRIYVNATRVYFVILILVLMLAGVGTALTNITTNIDLAYPTLNQYEKLPVDAKCSCSLSSLTFGDFSSLQARFHQVCASDLVTDRWIQAISSGVNGSFFNIQDFRIVGSAQFQGLAAFCRLSKAQVERTIMTVRSNVLFSAEVLSRNLFQLQFEGYVDQLVSSALSSFSIDIQMILQMIVDNQLVSGLQTNLITHYEILPDRTMRLYMSPVIYVNNEESFCDCTTNFNCTIDEEIFQIEQNITWTIPGLVVSCYPVNAVLLSTLECFYDQMCINELLNHLSITEQFQALSSTLPSRFSIDSIVQVLVDQLMIEQWIINASYEAYYSRCAPVSCSYSQVTKNGLLTILSSIVSILSGTTIVLGFLIPISIRSLEQPRLMNPNATQQHVQQQRELIKNIYHRLLEWNWFKHEPSNNRQIRCQLYGTRMCMLLIVISLALMCYFGLASSTISLQIVYNPNVSFYEILFQIYSSTIFCPCASVSVPYSDFLIVEPNYHQLCTSDFVTPAWFNYLRGASVSSNGLPSMDYRMIAPTYFNLLASFCRYASDIIGVGLQDLSSTKFIDAQVSSASVFLPKITMVYDDWLATLVNQYSQMIQLMKGTIHGNQLLSSLNFNYNPYVNATVNILQPSVFSNCSCTLSSSCLVNAALYSNNSVELFPIPNFYYGCFPSAGLLVSTLQCFYNQSCMLEIDSYFTNSRGASFNFSALDPTENDPTEPVSSMMENLFVNEWNITINFTSYYQSCAPLYCSYTQETSKSLFGVIITIIGVFGGVTLLFEILFLILVRIIERCCIIYTNFRDLISSIKQLFLCTDQQRVIRQLHFVFVVIALSALLAFNTFEPQLKNVTISTPSLETYQNLLKFFPDTLACPCSAISVNYGHFLSINIQLHQVCSSDFVTDRWFAFISNTSDSTSSSFSPDFLSSASEQFELLAFLCLSSSQTVHNELQNLYANHFISTNLISSELFMERVQLTTDDFQLTITQSFPNALAMWRELIGANMIMNSLSTNWIMKIPSDNHSLSIVRVSPVAYANCSCAQSFRCIQTSGSMYTGCYPLEALFSTTLQCFYNQSCIDPSNTFPALSIIQNSRFPPTATIELIFNQLMIENWTFLVSYEQYVDQCGPISCSYSYVDSRRYLEGVTKLTGFYGGFVILCRWMAVIVIKAFRFRFTRVRVVPISN